MSKVRLIIAALMVSTISVFAISAQQQLTPEEIIKRLVENGTKAKKHAPKHGAPKKPRKTKRK